MDDLIPQNISFPSLKMHALFGCISGVIVSYIFIACSFMKVVISSIESSQQSIDFTQFFLEKCVLLTSTTPLNIHNLLTFEEVFMSTEMILLLFYFPVIIAFFRVKFHMNSQAFLQKKILVRYTEYKARSLDPTIAVSRLHHSNHHSVALLSFVQ